MLTVRILITSETCRVAGALLLSRRSSHTLYWGEDQRWGYHTHPWKKFTIRPRSGNMFRVECIAVFRF